MSIALLDGQPTSGVWLTDRGLAYGDGVFETVALHDGVLLALDAHLARLDRGCRQLGITSPDAHLLEHECSRVAAGHDRGVLKLIVTRGSGGRGYREPPVVQPRRLITMSPWPASNASESGVAVWLCAHRLSTNPGTAGIKHLNRLDQVLASREWPAENCFEGLMFDIRDQLIEGTRSNLFLVQGGALHTALLDECGVSGIVRAAVIHAAEMQGVTVIERRLHLGDLAAADEVFITNSVIGVRGVNDIHRVRKYAPAPGPLTLRLAEILRVAAITP